MPSPLLRPLTPATEAYQQEQQAMAPVNQQAAEMDTIAQAQASEQAFAKQVQGQAAEAERVQRKQIAEQKAQESRQKEMLANAKRAGVKTTFDGGGQEQPVLHPDGQPVFEHGFQGDVQPGDNGHTVDYRDPRGRVYKVPTKAIRSSQDPAGNPLYEFDIKKEDGATDTIRQPVGSKPLWNTDPKTGKMYTGAADPETGSYGQTEIGVDTTVAGKAAIARQKELFDQQQAERKFQSESLMLDQNVRETNLAPVKKQLSEAQAAAKKLAKAKVQYKETPEGYIPMQDFGNGLVEGAPIPSTDASSIVKAKSWIEQKAATDKAFADAKAAHDPLAAEVQTMQQKRDQLAIEALNHSRSAQVQMMQMEKAQKAGLPVHEPDWQKRIAAARTDPRITSMFSQAELDQMGGPLAEDAKRISLPETTKLLTRAFTPDFNLDGTLTEDPTSAPAVPMQRPEASLANHISDRLAVGNVAQKSAYGYPIKSAKELGLDDYFKKHPEVAGMAWGGGENDSGKDEPRVIVPNEYNKYMSDPVKREGLAKIEAARHKMTEVGYNPSFAITPEQQQWRKGLGAYAQNDKAFKQSIVSRLLAHDDVPGVTAQQQSDAQEFERKYLPSTSATDVKSLTTRALGITNPEQWQVSPSQGISGELGYHTLTHNGEDIGEFSTRENRFVLNPPSSSDMDRQQQRLINTSSDGLPVYFASDTPPLPKAAVSDMIRQGVDISRSSTDRVAVESKLAEAKLSPADLRQKVMSGELSVQDGRMLNETFHGITDIDTSKEAVHQGFGKWLNDPQTGVVNGAQFRNGDDKAKQEVINRYFDQLSDVANDNIVPHSRQELASIRSEMLKPYAGPDFLGSGMGAGAMAKQTVVQMPPLIARGIYDLFGLSTAAKWVGLDTEADRLAWEQAKNENSRRTGFINRMWMNSAVKSSLEDLKPWADKANPGDEVPAEIAQRIESIYRDEFHRLDPEAAKTLDPSGDTFDVNKDPMLKAIIQRYLITSDPNTWSSLHSVLASDAKDRVTQKALMEYDDRPIITSVDDVVKRGKGLNLDLNPAKAGEIMALGKELEAAQDPKKAVNIITRAGGILGLTPQNAQLALGLLTRTENEDPNKVSSLWRSGWRSSTNEAAIEMLSTGIELGVGAFLAPETAGASLAAGVASKGARMGIKGAFKNAYRATIGAALRAGTERSATFAAARANFAAGRRSLGTAVSKAGGAYARAGIVQPTLGTPLTIAQKSRNIAVTAAKMGIVGAPIEAVEEILAETGSNDPSLQSMGRAGAAGAYGALILSPFFTAYGSARQSYAAHRAAKDLTSEKIKWADSINQAMAGKPNFKPYTPEDYDTVAALALNPAQQSAATDHYVAEQELAAAQEEHTSNVIARQSSTATAAESPRPTTHRLFEGGSPIRRNGEGVFHATDESSAFRLTGTPQIEDMIQSGEVRAKEGKIKGGRIGEVHWSRGHESLGYAPREGSFLLQTPSANLHERQNGIPLSEITIWQFQNGQWNDATANTISSHQESSSAQKGLTIPPSPRLLAAQANAQRTAANVEGLSSMAFSAMDELRALPDDQRPLYTGIAKAVSGATDYTEAEGKALIGLGGQSAIAFQQAQSLPADVAGPANVTQLPGAPTVTPTGIGSYRLPAGVRIQVPPQAIAALQERAPSLTGLIGGTQQNAAPVQNGSKAPNTAQSTSSTGQNGPQGTNTQAQAADPVAALQANGGAVVHVADHKAAEALAGRTVQKGRRAFTQRIAGKPTVVIIDSEVASQKSRGGEAEMLAEEVAHAQTMLDEDANPDLAQAADDSMADSSPDFDPKLDAFMRANYNGYHKLSNRQKRYEAVAKIVSGKYTGQVTGGPLMAILKAILDLILKRNPSGTNAALNKIAANVSRALGQKAPVAQSSTQAAPLTPALETRLKQHGLTVSYTPEEQSEVNQKWGPQSPFNIPPAFVQGGKGTAVAMPKDAAMDDTPISENEVLSTVQNVVEKELRKRNTIAGRPLIVTSHYQAHDGGADYNYSNDTVRVNTLRLAISIWADRSTKPTRAEVARAAELVIDHEVVHAAQMQAAKDTFAKLPIAQGNFKKLPPAEQHKVFMGWVDSHYGDMWRTDLKDVHDATMKIYGSVLEGRPDWHKAFEALRMIVQERTAGSTSEAATFLTDRLREHLKAALAVLKRWYADVMAGVADKPAIKAEIEAIEALLANNSQANTPETTNNTSTNENQTGSEKGNGQGRQGEQGQRQDVLTGSAASPPNTGGEVVSRNLQIPLGKGGAKLDATFPDAESLAAFQFQDIIDSATKGKTPEERDAARQRGAVMLNAMAEDPHLLPTDLTRKLQEYRASIIEQAAESFATFPLKVFTPPSFHSFAKTDESASKTLPPPEGGDIISGMQGQGIRRIGPPENTDGWAWYRELEADAAQSKLKPGEAQRLARAGDLTDARARLAWINENVVSRTSGRSIDEAAAELNSSTDQQFPVESGDQLGRAIMEALDARAKAKQGGATPETAQEQQAKDAAASFATLAAGAEGQPFTASQLSKSLSVNDELKIGPEYFHVVEVAPDDEYVRMESDRFKAVEITGNDTVNLTEGANGAPIESLSHPPVTHTLPDGYKLTKEGLNTIGSAPTRAYHGTPHKVDKFSMSKVGTGEGAQAYGYGLYFAQSEAVGAEYRDKLAQWSLLTSDGKIYNDRRELKNLNVRAALNKNGSIDDAITRAKSVIGSIPGTQGAEFALADIATLEKLKVNGGLTKTTGNLYTVDLLPSEDEFLDWDLPLSEQSEKVKAAFADSIQKRREWMEPRKAIYTSSIDDQIAAATGADAYEWLASAAQLNSAKRASERILSLGIPGIRYSDGQSRVSPLEIDAAKKSIESWRGKDANQFRYAEQHLASLEKKQREGTRNYVIFDENLVRIIAENGKPIESLASAPSRYQSPSSMLAATQAQMQGAEGAKPAGLNSMFNPKPRIPATGERTLFQMPNPESIAADVANEGIGMARALAEVYKKPTTSKTVDLSDDIPNGWTVIQQDSSGIWVVRDASGKMLAANQNRAAAMNAAMKNSPPKAPAIAPRSIIDAYRSATVGQSSAMLPIRAVYEKARESQPELTPESFMQQVKAMDANETALIGLSETQQAVNAAKPFVVGPAGTEIAFPPELVQSAAILTNLDKVKAVRELLPNEQSAYDKAEEMLQASEAQTLGSAPSNKGLSDVEIQALPNYWDLFNLSGESIFSVDGTPYQADVIHNALDDLDIGKAWELQIENIRSGYGENPDKFGVTGTMGTSGARQFLREAEQRALAIAKSMPQMGAVDVLISRSKDATRSRLYQRIFSKMQSAFPGTYASLERNGERAFAFVKPKTWEDRAEILQTLQDHGFSLDSPPLNAEYSRGERGSIASAPTESAPAQATPDNESQVREIISSMPQVWQDVLKDFNAGKSVEDIAKARLYTHEHALSVLALAQGRFNYLRGALPTKPKVAPVPGGEPLFKGGRPDLAYSSIPAFAAVDQNRGTPEQVTHAEMQEAATRMFAIDPTAAEKLVTRWMDGGGMAFSVEDMPDGIKAIVADAQVRKASMALMTAAAQIFTVENAFAGGSSAKSARLIDLYRNSGEEFARALSQRRDVFETPAERNAWFLSEVLLTPPPSIRSEMKRNPANKAKILADWAARADQIKKELLAEGIDIDATMKQMAKERELAAATIPEAIKPAITQAPKSVRQLVKAILEGKSLKEAREAAGLTKEAAIKAYNGFRDAINKAGLKAAQVARDAMLGSAPSETDFAAQLGLPEWTEEMDESAPVVQSKATKALAAHRRLKMEGEIDLKNPLSVNKARVAMQLRKATGFDALSEYWRASILSGPLTAIVNVTSGVSYGAYEATFKKLSAAAMADVARLFGFKPDAPSLRDLPAMLAAVMPSLKLAGKDMIASWNTETTGFDAFASDDGLFSGTSSFKEQFDPALKGLLGKVMRGISFRHMGAADEFVKSFFTRIEVASQAAQIARNEGKTGEALATAMKDLMRPGSLAWERSLAQAKRITFQDQEVGRGKERRKLDSPLQPGHATIDVIDNLADAISRTKKGDFGNALKVLSHFVFPFVSTPTNIFKEGVTMSPMGGVLAIIDAARAAQRYSKGNKQEAARIYNAARAFNDITNQIVCWGFILGLSSLVKPGDGEDERPFITGGSGVGGDASSGERENAYRTAPPYSIRIGDTWHSYRRLDPFGSALAFMVDSIREFQSGKSIDKIWAKIGTGMLETMQDKTFMKSMSDVLNIMRDPERYGTRWFTGIATGFVPNLIRQPLRATDPVFRESDFPNDMGFVESVARRVGFGMFPSPSNPIAPIPAIDAFGREATKSTGTGQPGSDILLRLVSPIETREGSVGREGQPVDPLDVKILRYNMTHDKGFGFTAPSREIQRTINGKAIKISLTDEEYLDYEKKSGQGFHNAMKTIYGQKQGDFSEADFADINHLHARVMEPFGNDVFSKALRKRQADGTLKP